MHLIEDIKTIFRKEWKLFLLINAIYFGVLLIGAVIAIMYPDLQMSLINATGESFGSEGPLSSVGEAYSSSNIPAAAFLTFVVNFFLGTITILTIPSIILPFWALIFGAYRALLWGIMLVVPIPGVLPFSVLLPHYLTLLLEGEAYVVAIFACTRGLIALLKPRSFGTPSRLGAYKKALFDNGKLLLVVAAILAVAAVYEAVEVTYFAGEVGEPQTGQQFGFYDEEFGTNSSYSNWTMTIPANNYSSLTFDIPGGKLSRMRAAATDGHPIDVMVMDEENFTAFNTGAVWEAYVNKQGITNETFDFVLPQDGTYRVVMRNTGDQDAPVHMQLRYKK